MKVDVVQNVVLFCSGTKTQLGSECHPGSIGLVYGTLLVALVRAESSATANDWVVRDSIVLREMCSATVTQTQYNGFCLYTTVSEEIRDTQLYEGAVGAECGDKGWCTNRKWATGKSGRARRPEQIEH